jgi:dihydroxyacetone kinase-like predicted kinase
MTIAETFPIPEAISFEEAIALTRSFLAEMQQGSLSDSQIEQTIAALAASENGARGFFVTYLTDERSFADQPSNPVVQGLRSSPNLVSELLVKNLAMSTAMILAHTRNQNLEMAQGSERVQRRTVQLIQLVKLAIVQTKLQALSETIAMNAGHYQRFLERWGYDIEQRDAMQQILKRVIT